MLKAFLRSIKKVIVYKRRTEGILKTFGPPPLEVTGNFLELI